MRTLLKEYFSTTWLERDRSLDQYTYTGWALLDKIGPHENVLDVGCGTNPFKPYLGDRVYGIDITDVGADEVVAIEDFYTTNKFDVAFCLGSINFGNQDTINNQLDKIDKCLNSGRIYWRCNPGRYDHGNDHFNNIDVFDWDEGKLYMFADMYGYEVADMQKDGNRIYSEWIKI